MAFVIWRSIYSQNATEAMVCPGYSLLFGRMLIRSTGQTERGGSQRKISCHSSRRVRITRRFNEFHLISCVTKDCCLTLSSFRWDYVDQQKDKESLPGFRLLHKEGVRAKWVNPIFPSLSYASWTTLSTGEQTLNKLFLFWRSSHCQPPSQRKSPGVIKPCRLVSNSIRPNYWTIIHVTIFENN